MQTTFHSLNGDDPSARAHDPDQLANAHLTGLAPARPQQAELYDDADDDDDHDHNTRGAFAFPQNCAILAFRRRLGMITIPKVKMS